MQPKPNPADFTHNGELQQPHYDNAVRAWEKLERMEQNEIEKAAEKRYGIKETKINCIQRACFRAGAEWANEQKGLVSVKDTLPTKEYNELSFTKFCIVKSMEGQVTAYYHYRDDQWYTEKEPLNGHRYRPIFNVTHWKNI